MEIEVKINTVPPSGEAINANAWLTERFTTRGLNTIAGVINQTVAVLKEKIDLEQQEAGITLSEVEVSFGIDFEAGTNVPIIGAILGTNFKSGATFQVHLKLTRND